MINGPFTPVCFGRLRTCVGSQMKHSSDAHNDHTPPAGPRHPTKHLLPISCCHNFPQCTLASDGNAQRLISGVIFGTV